MGAPIPMPDFRVILGDSLEVMSSLPSDFFTAVVTDPPYNSGGFRPNPNASTTTKYTGLSTSTSSSLSAPDFLGDHYSPRAWRNFISLWLRESYRLLSSSGVLEVFTDWRQLRDLMDAVEMAGFTTDAPVVWYKPMCRVSDWFYGCEYVVTAHKGRRPHLPYPRALYSGSAPTSRNRRHITEKPSGLMQHLISPLPRGPILDPFLGSGTTGVAALELGHDFVGIELSPHYAAVSHGRLSAVSDSLV